MPRLHEQELVSDEIQEVISYRPHWIVRRGNTVFLLVLLLLLGLTWVIKYPDVVNTSATLMAVNPPKLVNAKTDGKLIKLFVTNEQIVKKGQEIAYIESIADFNEVSKLRNWIIETIMVTNNNEYNWLLKNSLPVLSNLGELQTNYQDFQNQLEITKQTLASGYYQQKKGALQKDLNYISKLKNNTSQQQQIEQQDQALLQKEFDAYEKLANEKVIAPLELNQYKSKLLARQQSIKQTDAQITNNDMSSHSTQKQILDLQKEVLDQQQQFRSSLLQLKSEIDKWMQEYIVTAPEDGKVLFISSLQENEVVAIKQALFYIQPEQTKFYCELMAGQQGLGKVKVGQKVMIKINSFPSNEFGYLTGIVDYISNIPSRRDSFLIKVSLPKGLKTNYGKEIFFKNDLLAQAEIITDDRKLFDRLTGQLKKIRDR